MEVLATYCLPIGSRYADWLFWFIIGYWSIGRSFRQLQQSQALNNAVDISNNDRNNASPICWRV